jgi:AcrR family transcriptional regulator
MSVPDRARNQDRVLDAARATVLDFGVSRTTVSEVARRAGLSRMTVYRRYPDGAALMRALMSREFGALLESVRAWSDDEVDARTRLVQGAAETVSRLHTDPLLQRLLELEPELLMPYVVERVGQFQEMARAVLREGIAQGHADGSIRPGDPEAMAAAIETSARGFVLSARALTGSEREAMVAELEQMLEAYLRPA